MTRTLILASELTSSIEKLGNLLVGGGRKLLFIPTAATGEGWTPNPVTHVLPFERMGFEVVTHDLSKSDEPLPKGHKIDDFSAVYVCGGNTFFLMKHMRRTEFDRLICDHIDLGLVYIGSSAGAVAVTPDIGYSGSIDDAAQGDGYTSGLGLVGFSILPHLDHPEMGEAAMNVYINWEWTWPGQVFGLKDPDIILIEGSKIRLL